MGGKMNADKYCKGYMDFLNKVKTEREAVAEATALSGRHGFSALQDGGKGLGGDALPDRFYVNHRDKALILFVKGRRPVNEGLSIAASHIDSPRLDLKMKPLYEEKGMAFFDTHYYGGIKAYQWTGIPLALHGIVIRKDGTALTLSIGEDRSEPVFFIADLLPHLARRQMELPGKDLVKTEDLDLVAGLNGISGRGGAVTHAADGEVKLNVLRILKDLYGVCEDDLVSAELCAVPAFPARDLGLDRSMVGSYGQDDKVCAYPALTSLFSLGLPEYCSCVVLADKEETGSLGMTGMRSVFFKNFIGVLAEARNKSAVPPAACRERDILSRSFCISADVNTAFHPLYPDVFDRHGEARMNRGVVLFRYWGRGGKENTNDASAETVAYLRKILDDAGISWQTGEGGRVDEEDSGTISKYFANMDIPTVDLGVPLLSMHSPFEAAAKADVYMMHRALEAFFNRTS
jgi:aspartyl aminopeptidase